MASATFSGCSFAGGAVQMSLTYDDVSLAVQTVVTLNQTSQPAAAVITQNGTPQTFTVAANSPQSSTDVSGLGLVMTSQQVTHHGVSTQIINLPVGVSASYRYPA
jgi:hypothetical protein